MASSGSKKSSKTTQAATPFISTRRKMEILGLTLMVFALLLSLALVTYHPADDAIARSVDLGDALVDPGAHQEQFRVRNALGLVGAELARVLVPGFLGYTVLLLTGLLMVWGYTVFRHLEVRRLVYLSGLVAVVTFVLACLIGWFGHALSTDLMAWAGSVGMGVSGWMQRVVGAAGSLILLLLSITVMLMLVVDHDIQRSIDRVVDAVRSLRATVTAWWTQWQARREERRAQRAQAREQAQREREQRQAERERKRKEREQQRREQQRAQEQPPEATRSPREATASDSAAAHASPQGAQTANASTADSPPQDAASRDTQSENAQTGNAQTADAPSAPPANADAQTGDASQSAAPADAALSGDTTASGDAATPPSAPVVRSGDDDLPMRRNDLFRDRLRELTGDRLAGPNAPSDAPDAETDPDTDPDTASQDAPDRRAAPETQELDVDALEAEFSDAFDEAADTPAEDDPAEDPSEDLADPSPDEAVSDEAASNADEPAAGAARLDDVGAPGDDLEPDEDVEMTVQEQVEEEKADDIDRAEKGPKEIVFQAPPIDLLTPATDDDRNVDHDELEANKRILLEKLKTYNIEIQDIKAVVGPTVTRYELTPAPGIKVSRIKSLEDDLAMAMAAQGIRMIAPIPGKSAVGVEIPNRNRELVRLRDVIGTAKFRDTDMELPIPLGKSIEGEVFLADLTKMPHLLIAGATGSGKSVGLNGLITGLIYASHPANLKFVIVDPKKIELQQYTHLRDHFIAKPEDLDEAVITDVDMALGVLKSCEKEMESRYDLLSEASVRGIQAYNRKFEEGKLDPADGHRHMPYIVVVVDELADLMMTAGKEIEGPIARLAQMARAVGIHLVLATQRPSVDVITGLIKANFPSRIAFEVASRVDSRTILDQIGAEGLVGNGDLLFQSGSKMVRLQGPFVSVEEVEAIVDFIADQEPAGSYHLPSLQDAGHGPDVTLGVEDTDELFEDGARVIVRRQQGSVSLLQRKLAVGYTRAARIVDQLEEAGIVGPFNGTKARDVLVEDEEQLDRLLDGEDEDDDAAQD